MKDPGRQQDTGGSQHSTSALGAWALSHLHGSKQRWHGGDQAGHTSALSAPCWTTPLLPSDTEHGTEQHWSPGQVGRGPPATLSDKLFSPFRCFSKPEASPHPLEVITSSTGCEVNSHLMPFARQCGFRPQLELGLITIYILRLTVQAFFVCSLRK